MKNINIEEIQHKNFTFKERITGVSNSIVTETISGNNNMALQSSSQLSAINEILKVDLENSIDYEPLARINASTGKATLSALRIKDPDGKQRVWFRLETQTGTHIFLGGF